MQSIHSKFYYRSRTVRFFLLRLGSGSLFTVIDFLVLVLLPVWIATAADFTTPCVLLCWRNSSMDGALFAPLLLLCSPKYCSTGSWHSSFSVRIYSYPSAKSSFDRSMNDLPITKTCMHHLVDRHGKALLLLETPINESEYTLLKMNIHPSLVWGDSRHRAFSSSVISCPLTSSFQSLIQLSKSSTHYNK